MEKDIEGSTITIKMQILITLCQTFLNSVKSEI